MTASGFRSIVRVVFALVLVLTVACAAVLLSPRNSQAQAAVENEPGQRRSLILSGRQITDDVLKTKLDKFRRDHEGSLAGLKALFIEDAPVTDVGLKHLHGLTITDLWLTNTLVTDAGFEYFKEVPKLKLLVLQDTSVSGSGLGHLRGLSELRALCLDRTKLTNAGLSNLKGFDKLDDLHLNETRITDAGLVHLKGLTNLRDLELGKTPVTDAGLAQLVGLSGLKHLSLVNTRVTDVGLSHVGKLVNLEMLELNGTDITDGGLEHLRGLSKLRFLQLHETKVTDAGLVRLQGLRLTSLQILVLGEGQCTAGAVKDFEKKLPGCSVSKFGAK